MPRDAGPRTPHPAPRTPDPAPRTPHPFAAVVEAGRVRLRPILMTTLTTLLGLLPMAIGIGEGSESNVPLARAVVGGLTASTVFTLVLVPVLYTMFRRRERTASGS